MTTARVTSRGRITIPADIRNNLKLGTGDRLEFVLIAPGCYELVARSHDVTELKGLFGKPTKTVSVDDMNEAVARRSQPPRPCSG